EPGDCCERRFATRVLLASEVGTGNGRLRWSDSGPGVGGREGLEIRLLPRDRTAGRRLCAHGRPREGSGLFRGGGAVFDDAGNALQLCALFEACREQRRSAGVDEEAGGNEEELAEVYANNRAAVVPQGANVGEGNKGSVGSRGSEGRGMGAPVLRRQDGTQPIHEVISN